MTPPRLAYLVSQYPAVNHTFILREIRQLRELGIEIEVVSIRRPDRPFEKLSEVERSEAKRTFAVLEAGAAYLFRAHFRTLLGHPIQYFGGLFYAVRLGGSDPVEWLRHAVYFAEAVAAGHWIERLGLEHLHSHFTSTVALLISRVFPIGLSITIHGPDEFKDVASFHLREKVAGARFVCAISHYAASQLMSASDPGDWGKIEVARLGVDTTLFPPRPEPSGSRFELLCVGRLAPVKAQSLLIAAVDRLRRKGRESIYLRLVGDGPSRAELETMIAERGLKDHVNLEGACNQDRVQAFYRETNLFVSASFAEGIPVVLMEAMSMEIPCIATWITGIPELIRHGEDGWLVPPGNEEELAAAIERFMDDPELRHRLGAAGRVRVREKYDLRKNVRRLAEILERRLPAGHVNERVIRAQQRSPMNDS